MLKIGYIRATNRDQDDASHDAALRACGCGVVRREEPALHRGPPLLVLGAILEFIGEGDQLVVSRLEHLGASGRAMLGVLERLERRGASLQVLNPDLSSLGPGGPALRAALEAVAPAEPETLPIRRPTAAPQDIRDLQRSGIGPVEIARRLGVSRMTVWRKLKTLEACDA